MNVLLIDDDSQALEKIEEYMKEIFKSNQVSFNMFRSQGDLEDNKRIAKEVQVKELTKAILEKEYSYIFIDLFLREDEDRSFQTNEEFDVENLVSVSSLLQTLNDLKVGICQVFIISAHPACRTPNAYNRLRNNTIIPDEWIFLPKPSNWIDDFKLVHCNEYDSNICIYNSINEGSCEIKEYCFAHKVLDSLFEKNKDMFFSISGKRRRDNDN